LVCKIGLYGLKKDAKNAHGAVVVAESTSSNRVCYSTVGHAE
jgi:hypothetical protein